MAQMKIIVNTTDGDAVSIDVRPDETYRMLKERIHVDSGIDLDISQIFYDGKQVDEDQNVYDSFIGDSETGKLSESSNITCVVEGCPHSKLTHPDTEIFLFPLEPNRFSSWLLACNRHDLLGRLPSSLNLEYGVCSSHFTESCFVDGNVGRQLREDSVPVLDEQQNNFSILESGIILADVKLETEDNMDGHHVDDKSITFVVDGGQQDLPLITEKDERIDQTNMIQGEPNQDEVDEEDLQDDELDELEEEDDDDEEEEAGSDNDDLFKTQNGLLCRLCAQLIDEAHFIFTEKGKEDKILEKISTSLPISVHCNDLLPKQVCSICYSSLNACYDFVLSCVKAEETLKKMVPRFRSKRVVKPPEKKLLNGNNEKKISLDDEHISNENVSECYDCPLCRVGTVSPQENVDIDELEGRDSRNDPDIVEEYLADSVLWVEDDMPHLNSDEETFQEAEEDDDSSMCMICGESFQSITELLEHSHCHSIDGTLSCCLCGLTLGSKNDFTLHLNLHQNLANGPRYKCGHCGKLFSSEGRAEFHQECAHGMEGNSSLACSECFKVFRTEGNLWDHVRIVHRGEEPYSCYKCGKVFHIKACLKSHLHVHARGSSNECNVCGEMFSDQESLRSHEVLHTENKTLQCDQCGRCFISKYLFAAHVRAHLERKQRVYTCRVCGEDGFQSLPKLLAHRRSMHQDVVLPLGMKKDKTHKCQQCDKAFAGRVALKHHMMSHTGDLPHVCDFCNKGFTQKRSLMLHRRTHTGEKPYECGECGKRFVQSAHLYSHLRLHTGEKPYQCSQCDATFRLKDVRDSHQRKHTGERPFKCKVCEKAFRTSHSYYQHTWIHTGRKPYPCTYCGKAFRRSNGLKVHIRIHTGEKPHVCDLCGRGFAQKQDMKKHRNLHTIGKL